ncbi:dioxygenase [Pseudoalteromonas sp. KG3]|jgi:4,5-DOPA dioxygenase extradiol|uniref:Dioxygenase n=1 Tax=Pseudoalteromonas prydzensis TaxID=182141 RepID=A0ABR9FG00_9GAMM|nr:MULTISPECIES: class III extradiol ring-cleavage dioxygenase [Pseudoalteromonas]MBE0455887.1 dioxygenase [Pseudoalteromonas prydzensis]WKD25467.1 dioxygenase [Pseudoalteromonas sp. KG3]
MLQKPNVFFLSHGGGPLPLLGEPSHKEMVTCLQSVAAKITKPSAILMISAHFEADPIAITASATPKLIYDYYGFPEQAYQLTYPCAGEPKLAEQVQQALQSNGITANLDTQRGFDHGMFVPLKIMFPEADIPCVQISLNSSLDPAMHLKIGQVLQQIDYENLLIIGSGFTFHNMQAFFAKQTTAMQKLNQSFEQWLIDTLANPKLAEPERTQRLTNWKLASGAQFCHPREEHLLPLHVCYGAAQRRCESVYELEISGKKASMYLWQ